jgi:hypothetical protein
MASRSRPDEDAWLRRQYQAGVPLVAIAREIGRSDEAVAARRAMLGLRPRQSSRPWSGLEDTLLREAASIGLPASVLARRLRRSAGQVRARQLGLHRTARRRRWTVGEDVIVRDGDANGLTCAEIAAELIPRTPTAVAARARRLGLATYARRWTAEDDARLRRILPRSAIDQAARDLGRTPEGVRRRARTLGIATPREHKARRAGARWTTEEDELLGLHASLNPAVLSALLGRSDPAIAARLRRLGLRAGRWRSPHHPCPTNGGLTPGERVLVEREVRDRGRGAVPSLEQRLQRPLGAISGLVRRQTTRVARPRRASHQLGRQTSLTPTCEMSEPSSFRNRRRSCHGGASSPSAAVARCLR